jgi:3',5'-cyclic AMP phosphodiesterase CpdA
MTRCTLGLAILLSSITTPAWAAPPAFSYGPIVGRGETADRMIVKWGTSAADATTLYYRKIGGAWATATGAASADHEVVLTALEPGTTYEYAFASGDPAFASMATCPASGAPIDVVIYGDNRPKLFGSSQHATVLTAIKNTLPDLIVSTGDLTYAGSAFELQTGFFPEVQAIVKSTPYMASPGNHEATLGIEPNYGRFFPTPRPDAAAWRPFYAFVCSNVMFISLNGNTPDDGAQMAFLNEKLAAAKADASIDFVVPFFHQPPYSVGTHGDSAAIQAAFVPQFSASPKVIAVFSGHDHNYGHFTNGSQVHYFVTGGGGADLYDDTGPTSATKVSSKKAYHFIKAHFAGKGVSFTAVDTTGTTIDTLLVGTQGPPADMGGGSPDLGAGKDAGTGGGVDGGVGGGDDEGGCSFGGRAPASSPAALCALGLAWLVLRRRRPAA